jgi:hypothetical protein
MTPRVLRRPPRVAAACFLLGIAGAVLGLACTPSPRNIPCSNGGDCQKADPKFAYCLEARCVECVGDAACGLNQLCVDGRCRQQCATDADCAHGTCDHKVCTD